VPVLARQQIMLDEKLTGKDGQVLATWIYSDDPWSYLPEPSSYLPIGRLLSDTSRRDPGRAGAASILGASAAQVEHEANAM
jgi:hypothetical protein